MKQCKKCSKEVESQYSEVMESREIVVVDEQTEQAIILNKGDKLCQGCSSVVAYYRRIK